MISGRVNATLATLAVAVAAATGSALSAPDGQETVIIPGAVLMPDGTLAENLAVVVRDGKIASIDDADEHAEREDALRRPGAVLSPGLVDPYSVIGVRGGNVERVHSIDPDLEVAAAIDWWDPTFADAVAGGVTTVMVVPGANNLVGGMTAVVRMGNELVAPELLKPVHGLLVSLGPPALNPRQAPTSRSGAITMLRGELNRARNRSGQSHERLALALDGSLPIFVRADGGEDVTAALRLFETYGLGPTIVHRNELHEVIDDLVEAPVPVILGPYGFGDDARVLSAPARLAAAGVDIAFAGNTPVRDGAGVRLSAAMAVRAGLDPATARRALTVVPALLLGVESQVGSIAPGRDADLVLFSRDPLRADARVLEVWLRGTLVHAAADLDAEILRLEEEGEDSSDPEGDVDDDSE